jgi:hypothetical protein
MTATTATTVDPLKEWDLHLKRELDELKKKGAKRAYTFDMDDAPEEAHLKGFDRLRTSLEFLNATLVPVYHAADKAAVSHQTIHRRLAKTAIIAGGFAIACAILQLVLRQSAPSWTELVAELEYASVAGGGIAVIVGLFAKFNNKWFLHRHTAERLRMLKFRALGQPELWADDREQWQAWVTREIQALQSIKAIKEVRDWSAIEKVGVVAPEPPQCIEDQTSNSSIALYYCHKRVGFQAHYFEAQSKKYKKQSHWLHRTGLPLFFASVLAVIGHFVADRFALAATEEDVRHTWELVGIWCVALAALLPVVSFGIRAWIGAFELARSAHLFEVKRASLLEISSDLLVGQAKCATTMRHIAHVERYLEDEHREWLRLLMDAEWFL